MFAPFVSISPLLFTVTAPPAPAPPPLPKPKLEVAPNPLASLETLAPTLKPPAPPPPPMLCAAIPTDDAPAVPIAR